MDKLRTVNKPRRPLYVSLTLPLGVWLGWSANVDVVRAARAGATAVQALEKEKAKSTSTFWGLGGKGS